MPISRRLTAATLLAACLIAPSAFAASVRLIGVAADPLDYYSQVPSPPIPASAAELAALSDGDTSTGYTYTAHQGEYTPDSRQLIGFAVRFDFDVSGYDSIERIDFTWTGLQTWTGAGFPNVYLGYFDGTGTAVQQYMNFGSTGSGPDFLPKTGALSYFSGTNLSNVVHGGVASFWAVTEHGISVPPGANVDNLGITTFEVTANVTGTPAVPLPGAFWLLLSGAGALIAKRPRFREAFC